MTFPCSILYGLFMHRNGDYGQPIVYEIRLQGHLSPRWNAWFGGFRIELRETGATILTGAVADQAALYGLLKKVRDLGLPLLAVNQILDQSSKELPK